jgi:hypothetical protein
MEFSDFARYWAAYAWATDDYLQRLSESGSMRLTEPVHAAYLAEGCGRPAGIYRGQPAPCAASVTEALTPSLHDLASSRANR